MKVIKYKDEDAKREASKRCRIFYQKLKTLVFVIDDEKYCSLSGFQMSANRGYYTSDLSRTPMAVKNYAKKKFEPKVMLWIAMPPKGMSTPVLTSGRSMAVTARSYIDIGTPPGGLPEHPLPSDHGGYIFWPDKASAHYARISTDFLDNNYVRYVKNSDNSTEVPQCRPI